jgi:hypothetical protein
MAPALRPVADAASLLVLVNVCVFRRVFVAAKAVRFHEPAALTTFRHCIAHVFEPSAEPKVGRIDAAAIVARMANVQLRWRQLPICSHPRNSVCPLGFEGSAQDPRAAAYRSVSSTPDEAAPLPAFIGSSLNYIWPEAAL